MERISFGSQILIIGKLKRTVLVVRQIFFGDIITILLEYAGTAWNQYQNINIKILKISQTKETSASIDFKDFVRYSV